MTSIKNVHFKINSTMMLHTLCRTRHYTWFLELVRIKRVIGEIEISLIDSEIFFLYSTLFTRN